MHKVPEGARIIILFKTYNGTSQSIEHHTAALETDSME